MKWLGHVLRMEEIDAVRVIKEMKMEGRKGGEKELCDTERYKSGRCA